MAWNGAISNFHWTGTSLFQNVSTTDDYALHFRVKYPESYAGGGGYQTMLSDGSVEFETHFAGGNSFGAYGIGGDRFLWLEGSHPGDAEFLRRWHSVWQIRKNGAYIFWFDGRYGTLSSNPATDHSLNATYTVGTWGTNSQNCKAIYEHVAFYHLVTPPFDVVSRVLRGLSPVDAWPGVRPAMYMSGNRPMPEWPVSGWSVTGTPLPGPAFNSERDVGENEGECLHLYSAGGPSVAVGGRILVASAPRRRWSF